MRCEGLPVETYSFYVLGTLTAPELAVLNSHLESECEMCRSEIAAARRVWTGVALSAPQVEPRRALRKRVIASVQDPDETTFSVRWWHPVTALAAVSLAIVAGWQLGSSRLPRGPLVQTIAVPSSSLAPPDVAVPNTNNELERENRTLRQQLARATGAAVPRQAPVPALPDNSALLADAASQRQQLAIAQQELGRQKELLAAAERNAEEANRRYTAAQAQPKPDSAEAQRQVADARNRALQLERDLSQYKALLATARQKLDNLSPASAILADPNLKLVRLRGTEKGSAIEAHVFVASGSRVLFFGSQLPALPPGRAYQLWLIRASAPAIVSAGVFQPNAQRQATVQFENSGLTSGITTIAVTDEPEGGSASPTGHKVLIGS